MKILAFVDVHGNTAALKKLKKKAENADLVVCAGDITIFEMNMHEIISRLSKMNKPILIIHGNHETEQVIAKAAAPFENVCYMHKKSRQLENVLFIGFGGGGFSLVDKGFESFAKKFRKVTCGLKVVLVTHAPPYGTKLDMVMGRHCGNKTVRQFIERIRPALVICGHFHENAGREDKIKNTKIINPGPEGKILEI
jgi:hypothetical protein